MANALYDRGRQGFLAGEIAAGTDSLRIFFVDEADDTIDLAADEDLADRAAGSRVGTATAIASVTVVDGTLDAGDTTLSAVTGDQSESLDMYQHTGTESTSLMICNIDTATGLPVTPNGGDITVAWHANGIFDL